jgi:fucose permease
MKKDGYARPIIRYFGYGAVGLFVAWGLSHTFPAAMSNRGLARGVMELVMVFAIPVFIAIGWITVFILTLSWQMLKIWIARNWSSES